MTTSLISQGHGGRIWASSAVCLHCKLHFTKENILEIHRCAEFLRFQNLDKACFEFLIPKFSDGGGTSKKVKGKSKSQASHEKSQSTCSPDDQNPETGEDGVPQDASTVMQAASATSSEESPKDCPPITNDKVMQFDLSPLYERGTAYHMGDGQDQFCLQNCGPQLPSSSMAAAEVCPFLSISSTGDNEELHSSAAGDILAMEGDFQKELAMDVHCELPTDKDLNIASITEGHFDQREGPLMSPTDCSQLCPLNSAQSSGVLDSISDAPGLSNIGTDDNQVFDSNEQMFSELTPKDCSTERSTVEREVAEHLAKGFWPDLSSTLNEPLPLDSIDQSSAGNGSDFHWLKHLDLGAAPDDCPFLRDLSSNDRQTLEETLCPKRTLKTVPACPPLTQGKTLSAIRTETVSSAAAVNKCKRWACFHYSYKTSSLVPNCRPLFQPRLRFPDMLQLKVSVPTEKCNQTRGWTQLQSSIMQCWCLGFLPRWICHSLWSKFPAWPGEHSCRCWNASSWPQNSWSLFRMWDGGVKTAWLHSAAARESWTASTDWREKSRNWYIRLSFLLNLK